MTRDEFKAKALRSLGDGATRINVTPEQVEDRLVDSLAFFLDWYADATYRKVLIKTVTDAEALSRSFVLGSEITNVRIVSVINSGILGSLGHINGSRPDIDSLRAAVAPGVSLGNPSGNCIDAPGQNRAFPMIGYLEAKQSIQMLKAMEAASSSSYQHDYNRLTNTLHILSDDLEADVVLCLIVDSNIDDATTPQIFDLHPLLDLTSASIGLQWAKNLMKFAGNVKTAGGNSIDAPGLLSFYREELLKAQETIKKEFSPRVLARAS